MARAMEKFSFGYSTLFNELADPRVKNWLFMSDPGLVIIMVAAYIYIVSSLGPKLMEKQKPFKLKSVIIVYNLFQVIANAFLSYKIYTSGWSTTLSLGCEPIDYSDDPNAVSLLESCWLYMILKLSELIETIIYVLRKKQNQVSFLHVYHHISTLAFTWIATKYIGGGMSTFCIMINSIIHVIMYIYYLLAALGNETILRVISTWKKYLTAMQMIQFFIVILHLVQAMSPKCNVPKGLIALFIPNVILIFGLFYNFYKRAYRKNTNKETLDNGNHSLNKQD